MTTTQPPAQSVPNSAQAQTSQVYQLFIRATPEQIWEAITNPAFTVRYFHGARVEHAGGRRRAYGPDGAVWGDEAILESDPPRRLVHGWRSLYDPEMASERTSRVTWEIEPDEHGVCLLTLIHDELESSPKTAASVSGRGWIRVLSGLKTVLETGEPMSPLQIAL